MQDNVASPNNKSEKKENALLNIGLNVILPSVILTKASKPEYLGEVYALVVALAFPITYGIYDLITRKKFNFFSLLGLISVLLTGGIGLLKLDRNWMVVKETGIPLLMGIAVMLSEKTKWPLVKIFLKEVLDFEKITSHYQSRADIKELDKRLSFSTYGLGFTFFVSALLNYVLAIRILKGEPGSVEFNESLGKMTALSFPVISIPMMIMSGVILYYLIQHITKITELQLEDIVKNQG